MTKRIRTAIALLAIQRNIAENQGDSELYCQSTQTAKLFDRWTESAAHRRRELESVRRFYRVAKITKYAKFQVPSKEPNYNQLLQKLRIRLSRDNEAQQQRTPRNDSSEYCSLQYELGRISDSQEKHQPEILARASKEPERSPQVRRLEQKAALCLLRENRSIQHKHTPMDDADDFPKKAKISQISAYNPDRESSTIPQLTQLPQNLHEFFRYQNLSIWPQKSSPHAKTTTKGGPTRPPIDFRGATASFTRFNIGQSNSLKPSRAPDDQANLLLSLLDS
jgi:hypothetical protein